MRRGSIEVIVRYDVDLNRAQAVIRDATQAVPGVLAAPPASVRVRELGPDDVLLEARFWTDSRRSDFVATASAVRQAVVAALRKSGLPLPDPTLRVLLSDPGARELNAQSQRGSLR